MWRGSTKSSELPCKSHLWRKSQVKLSLIRFPLYELMTRICNWPTAVSCVEDPDAILPDHASSDRFSLSYLCLHLRTYLCRSLSITTQFPFKPCWKAKGPHCRAPPKPRDPAFNAINVDNSDYEDTFQVWLKPCSSQHLIHVELRSHQQSPLCLRSATALCRASLRRLQGKSSWNMNIHSSR